MALGKSLDNILGDYFGEEVVELSETKATAAAKKKKAATPNSSTAPVDTKTVVRDIAIADIELSPYQTRKQFNVEKLRSLSQSIKESGLIHPVIALERESQEDGQKPYLLIAGERRLRACGDLGHKSIMTVVKLEKELTSNQHALLTAMENLQREDLNPIELAHTFEMLMETQNLTEDGIAEMLEHSAQYVKNYLRLLTLTEPVQRALENGLMGEGQARHLVGLEDHIQLQLLDIIVQKQLTVREVQDLIQKMQNPLKEENRFLKQVHNISNDYYKRAEKLASYFPNSKLKCSGDDTNGKIVISWGK